MSKILPVVLIIFALFFAVPGEFAVHAQTPCPTGQTATDFGCIANDPVGFVTQFYGIGLSILGMVALLFLIVGGLTILSSQGNPDKVQRGREYIYYSIAGLLLAVFGFAFVRIIAGGILKIPGFS